MNTYSLSYIQLKDFQRLQYECGNSGRQTYGVSIFEQPSHLEMNTTFYPTPIGRNPFLSRIKLCCPIQSYEIKLPLQPFLKVGLSQKTLKDFQISKNISQITILNLYIQYMAMTKCNFRHFLLLQI